MPHARAAEAVGLAKMVTHVRVGMSAALGWLVRLDRPKEELPTEPGGLRPGRESGRTAAGNQDAVPDAAYRSNHTECATVTREPKQAVSGRLHVPCVTAHSGTPLSTPGHRLLPARVGSSLHSLWSGPEREGARNPAARTPRAASWTTDPAAKAAVAAGTPDSLAARTHQSRERTWNPILSPQS
jgi:hypothetical protein